MPASVRVPWKTHKLHSWPLAWADPDSGLGSEKEAQVLTPLPSTFLLHSLPCGMGAVSRCFAFAVVATSVALLQLCIPAPEQLVFMADGFGKSGVVGLYFVLSHLCKRLLWAVLWFIREKRGCVHHNKPFLLHLVWIAIELLIMSPMERGLLVKSVIYCKEEISHAWNQMT